MPVFEIDRIERRAFLVGEEAVRVVTRISVSEVKVQNTVLLLNNRTKIRIKQGGKNVRKINLETSLSSKL